MAINKEKTTVSNEVYIVAEALDEDIKILESTREQKRKTKATLLRVGKALEDSLTELRETVRELHSINPEYIDTLRVTSKEIFDNNQEENNAHANNSSRDSRLAS